MNIERHPIMDPADAKPIISRAVAHGDRVYVCGTTGDPTGDVTAQTRQALARIDELLARAGTDKTCGSSGRTTSPGTSGWTPSILRCAPASRPSCTRRACSWRSW